MNIFLWIIQVLFGVYFTLIGVTHFIIPPNLPPPMHWMYELPMWLHVFSGSAEILGGLGLILPGVTRIQTRLTPLAAAGLALVMIGAMVYHIPQIDRLEKINFLTTVQCQESFKLIIRPSYPDHNLDKIMINQPRLKSC